MTEEKKAIKILADELAKAMRSVSITAVKSSGNASADTVKASKISGLPAAIASILSVLEGSAASGDAVAQQTLLALNHIAAGEFETITADTAMIEKVYASFSSFINMVAQNATIGNLDVDSIRAGLATIGLLNLGDAIISTAQIERVSTGTLFVREEIGGKVYIDDLAVTDANIVSLAAGQILINDQEGNLVELCVDGDGNVSTKLVNYGGDNIISSNSMSGDRIIQHSITADRLNASEIFAKDATIMNIIGDNIDASRISTGYLDANIVKIRNLTVKDIVSGIIRSADYAVAVVPYVYPSSDLYPSSNVYPSSGNYVISGFAIDFSQGQIYGGLYTEQIANKLSKSGDTMTGAIVLATSHNYSNPPSGTEYTGLHVVSDSGSEVRGGIHAVRYSDGKYGTLISARSNTKYAGFGPLLDQSGNVSYSVPAPTALLSEIGVKWKPVTGSTSQYGGIGLNLDPTRYMVVGAYASTASGTNYLVNTFVAGGGASWNAKIEDYNHNAITGTYVSLFVAYIDFGNGAIS